MGINAVKIWIEHTLESFKGAFEYIVYIMSFDVNTESGH
jgi:glycerophosphoryl diester phosphodiesterase